MSGKVLAFKHILDLCWWVGDKGERLMDKVKIKAKRQGTDFI